MIFDAPWLLVLAPLVGAAIAALAWFARRKRIRLAARWSVALGRQAAVGGRWLVPALGAAALAAAAALAGPRFGRAVVPQSGSALSVVLAIDISRSMLAEDAAPSRLGRAVAEARRLVQDLPGDRVGLIGFAGRSYILTPLTVDGGAVLQFLEGLDPDIASEGGTNLTAMLAQGRELLSTAERGGERVLVVFSDGEGHDSLGGAVAAARALQDAGIRTVVVAEGGRDPVPIPLRDPDGRSLGFKLDLDGREVRTARSDRALQALVDATGGALVTAETADQAGAVRAVLAGMSRAPVRGGRVADLVPRGWIAVLAAVALLLAATVSRRSGALVALALAVGAGRAEGQRPSAGERALRAGDPVAAARAWLLERGAGREDTARYNAGTALLRAGRTDDARTALDAASRSLDPALRQRALYNLGTALLAAAARDSARRDTLLAESSERLKEALRLAPASRDAKWNLELALRRRRPPSGSGGGSPQGPPQGGGRAQSPPSQQDLDRAQADQILGSMERQEQQTRAEVQRRMRTRRSGTKDW